MATLSLQVEALNISTHGKNGAARLVAETKRLPHKNRSVPAMSVVMEIRATQSRRSDGYLNLVWPRGARSFDSRRRSLGAWRYCPRLLGGGVEAICAAH